jgi:DNA-binding beta-propeller fold protein YncE
MPKIGHPMSPLRADVDVSDRGLFRRIYMETFMKSFQAYFMVSGVLFGAMAAAPVRADFLYVTQPSAGTVSNVSSSGSVTSNSSGYSSNDGIAVNPSGTKLYVTNSGSNTFQSVSASGGTPGTGIATGNSPIGIATDSSGNIYVLNAGDGTVGKYNSSGTLLNGSFISGLTGSNRYLAIDTSGNVYITSFNPSGTTSTLTKFTSAGGSSGTVVAAITRNQFISGGAQGIALNGGFAYVANGNADSSGHQAVDKIDLSNGTVTTYNTSGTSLNNPFGVAFDSSGNLYVANNSSAGIIKIDTSGVASTFTASVTFGAGLAAAPTGSPEPSSLSLMGLALALFAAYRRWRLTPSAAAVQGSLC